MALLLERGPEIARKRVTKLVDETGELFVTLLEGLRRSWDIKTWWGEFIEQCWFIVRVTSMPVRLESDSSSALRWAYSVLFRLPRKPSGMSRTAPVLRSICSS